MMRRRIPFIQQLEVSDCGAACLAMVLAYHGRNVSPEEIRRATRTSRHGVDALSIVEAARAYGLDARGVSIELDGLPYLDRGSILHWDFSHFVVLDRVRRQAVDVLDPAVGRVQVPMDRFSASFTGVAITTRPGDSFQQGRSAAGGTWRYLRPILRLRGLLAKIGTTSLLLQLFALSVPIIMRVIVDRVVPAGDRGLLGTVAAGLAAVVGFHLLSTFVRAHLLLALRAHSDLALTTSFISHLVRLPYRFFLQRSTGDLMARLNSITTIREILSTTTISTMLDGLLASVYLLLVFAQSSAMGLVVLVVAAAQALVLLSTNRSMQRLMSESLQAQARSQGHLAEMVGGIETLKSVGAEEHAVSQWSDLFVDEINATLARGRLSAAIESANAALRVAGPLAVLSVGTLGVLDGAISLGTMLALSALGTAFLSSLSGLTVAGMQVQLLGSYMQRINDVLDAPPEQALGSGEPVGQLSGHVALERVSFSYDGQGPVVVDGVSLDMAPGRTVAIVGRSGSGKSTLANLVVGLYRPTAGSVLYDGRDLAALQIGSVRVLLGIVPQQSYLFGTSVRANIALTKPDASREEIERAAWIACIHDDILAMPMGYDTPISDGGASLSGGQRQRIALARALLREPKVLVLDEATSSLDAITEARIYDNLARLACTKIVIAHRISTIARADLIVVMEEGRFVEQGTHEELLTIGGRYHELASSQGQAADAGQ